MSLQVLPETVASKTDQPAMSFIKVVIGTRIDITTLPPRCVIGFEINRITGGGEEFTLTLFDENWEELEYLLAENQGNVVVSYGYIGGSARTISGSLTDYSIEFTNDGARIIASGVAESVLGNLIPITLDTNTLNPTEAAKSICKKQGWIVNDANFHPSNDIEGGNIDSLAVLDEYPIQYITTKLAPLAVRSSDGVTGYRFHLDESQNPPVAYFRPIDFQEDAIRTYVYMKGYDSSVLDLQLNVNGIFGGTDLVTTGLSSSFIDPDTKEVITIDKDLNSTRIYGTGNYTHTKSGVAVKNVDAAGRNNSQMNALLNYKMTIGMNGIYPYDGILQIVGDPDILFDSTIRLVIITNTGHLHHCSGLYRVDGIVDSISDGLFTTTLNIWKGEDIESGLEIVNPRVLLK